MISDISFVGKAESRNRIRRGLFDAIADVFEDIGETIVCAFGKILFGDVCVDPGEFVLFVWLVVLLKHQRYIGHIFCQGGNVSQKKQTVHFGIGDASMCPVSQILINGVIPYCADQGENC